MNRKGGEGREGKGKGGTEGAREKNLTIEGWGVWVEKNLNSFEHPIWGLSWVSFDPKSLKIKKIGWYVYCLLFTI